MLNSTKSNIQVVLNQRVKLFMIFALFVLFLISGCKSLQFRTTKKQVLTHISSKKFKQQHTGFLVVDVPKKDTIFNHNGEKYFTPASTTKLFTLYTSLQLLNKKTPAVKFAKIGQKTHVLPTGDPTWLHPHFMDTTAISFLKQQDSIILHLNNYDGEKFMPGWAWEDYAYYFSPELTSIPLFGNVITVRAREPMEVYPSYFAAQVQAKNDKPLREERKNRFYVPEQSKDTIQIPYITSDSLTIALLSDITGKKVTVEDSIPKLDWEVLPGIPTDTILKQMLRESDNFLAEHLMLMASSTLSDTISFQKAKDHILENDLSDLHESPRWVDGSGLSRYNLFTPKSMIKVLDELLKKTDSTRLFELLPRWDANGTWPNAEAYMGNAFIYAKSGSMGNMYNLCGYLKTKSGKLLLFSFMNNHFRRPSQEVRQDMFDLLSMIHEAY